MRRSPLNAIHTEEAAMNNFTPGGYKKLLLNSIACLLEDRELYLNQPDADFTRNRLISFENTILFSLFVGKGTLSSEILDYFPEAKLPSVSALVQQRQKINKNAYEDLFKIFTHSLPFKQRIKGLQLVAIDGTHVNVPYNPKDVFSFTNSIKNRKGFNQMLLCAAYDPLNHYYLDAVVQGYRSMNEPRACCEMIDRRSGKPYSTLYLMDRGFATFNTIGHTIHNEQYFLIRAKQDFVHNLSKTNRVLRSEDEFDEKITITIGGHNTQTNRATENFHFVSRKFRTYDCIDDRKDLDSLTFRVLHLKISDSTDEYIVTNLPTKAFSPRDIQELYRLRWNEETSFRALKYTVGLLSFHSKSHEFQIQEIFAKLTMYNFCSAVTSCTESKKRTEKYDYVTEKAYAFIACIEYLKGNIRNVTRLISKRLVPIRPGRSFIRCLRRQFANSLNYR